MSTSYTVLFPPVIRFGPGCRFESGFELRRLGHGPAPRTFAVCSRTLRANGMLDEIVRQGDILLCGVYDSVPHDPPLTCVDAIIERLRLTSAEAVLALGGGSVIDAAKAAAAVAPNGDHVRPYFEKAKILEAPGLGLVALPSTAGTGAEITKNAVLSDHVKGVKHSLRSPGMVPAAALVDPELTLSMPPDLTAQSGLDALTQALESYVSLKATRLTRPLAAQATSLLLDSLSAAYGDGTDVKARSAVAEGSLLSAMAFSQSGLGAVHGLAHPIGHALSLPHGFVCAVLLPHVLSWNATSCKGELDRLAHSAGLGGAGELVNRVRDLCADLGVPSTFADHGLAAADHHTIIANCRSGSMAANPRPMADADAAELLESLS